jgi:mono/diheme cytochrome c family protein
MPNASAYAIVIAAAASPGFAQDAATLRLGHDVYQDTCARCHGETATSSAMGDIRGLTRETYLEAIRGVDQMPPLHHMPEDQINAVIAWLMQAGDE